VATRLFVRRRDGRIEVRLNDAGRDVVREAVARVVAGEKDPEHPWHAALHSPIDPSRDDDDPVTQLSRERDVTTGAELVLVTLGEQFLTESEAWAWLTTLQVALRTVAVTSGILDEARLAEAAPELVEQVRVLQSLLFGLAECL
jgi:pyruvate-formate lyase-activating enzyme